MITLNLSVAILGLILGSFIYTVAMRLQNRKSLWKRSHCDHCEVNIGVIGLIPLLGYLRQRGQCSHCGQRISAAYPLVEIINALVIWLVFSKTGIGLIFVHMVVIFEIFYLIALIDFRSHLIYPHPILLGLLIECFWLFSFEKSEMLNALFGLFIGAGVFHWIAYLYRLARKKEGLGAGDATLLGLIGFVFGWQFLFPVIFWASVLGILGGAVILISNRESLKREIAFGPWLVLSAFLVWRFSELFRNLPLPLSK